MSNSKLATYTRISTNRTSPRNHAIDTITIHCIVGQWTAKQGCDYFATTDRECSANYVVGKDGSIGLSVEEKDRSWCTSSAANDNRAITIEVASDTTHPYAVTAAAYAALLDLVTDICKRNGIKKLLWRGDKSLIGQISKQNMTVHRWFANKACPGEYLYSRHGEIAEEVNKRIGAGADDPKDTPAAGLAVGDVVTFAGSKHYTSSNASNGKACKSGKATITKIAKSGKHPYHLVKVAGGGSTVHGWVDTADISATGEAAGITAGSVVRLNKGAKTYTGGGLASFVYTRDHVVKEISGDRVVITYGGVVVAAVKLADLVLVT